MGFNMTFLSFFSLLVTTALGLPQTQPLSRRAALAQQDNIDSPTHHTDMNTNMGARALMRPWKRTVSTGANEQASVYVCEHVFWGGKCETMKYNIGTDDCVLLDGETSSVRPEPGFSCVFYKNAVCRDFDDGKDSIALKDPGSENLLVTDEGDWNDQITAFQCFVTG